MITTTAPRIFKINTGFPQVDELVDFREGGTYIIAGYKKSGKSSFLLSVALHLLKDKHKIAYFDTELSDEEAYVALTAIHKNKSKSEIEEQLGDKEISFKNIAHFDPQKLSKNDVVSFEVTMELAKQELAKGTKIFFFDNLTTYMAQAEGKQNGWQVLQSCANRIKDFTKINNVISFFVVHTKDTVVFNETPTGIRSLIENNNAEQVFEKSITVISKPSAADIYGGSSYQGQMSGTVIIWRPFQQYDLRQDLQQLTQVILEDFRHHRGGSVRMVFDGAKGSFSDDWFPNVKENLK